MPSSRSRRPSLPFSSLRFPSLHPFARTAIAILDLRHPTKDVVLFQLVLIMGANHEHSAGLLFLSSAKAGAVAPVTCGGCMGTLVGNVCAFSLVTSFHASNVKSGSTASRLGRSRMTVRAVLDVQNAECPRPYQTTTEFW